MHAVEMGVDLRGVTMIAFGGAGPVHACGVAELLESPAVIFPVNASVLSAFGTLVTPVRIDLGRSMVRPMATVSEAERDALLDELREEGRRVLAAAGVADGSIRFRFGVDARYIGQGNEITIWVGEGDRWPVSYPEVVQRFEEDYRKVYGLTIPDVGVEAVTWRLSAFAEASPIEPMAQVGHGVGEAHSTRPVRFSRGTDPLDTPVYRRLDLGVGQSLVGPAIVEERETTTVIRPGWTAEVAPDGSLIAVRASATTEGSGS
jgi:N-methylhydantoinase A